MIMVVVVVVVAAVVVAVTVAGRIRMMVIFHVVLWKFAYTDMCDKYTQMNSLRLKMIQSMDDK